MRTSRTIILVVLAALSVLGAWQHHRRTTSGEDAGTQLVREKLLTAKELPVDAVTEITLQRADAAALTFRRDARGWTQVEPFAFPMDPFSIRQMAVQAAEMQVTERIALTGDDATETGAALATLGLDPPRCVVTYHWEGGSCTLHLGRRGLAGRAYAYVPGRDHVDVINAALQERLVDMDPREWRDRRIFTDVSVDSERLVRDEGNYRMVLVRTGRTWTMTEPVQTRLDTIARDELFNALGNSVVGGFVLDLPDDAALQRFGLADPVATLSITTTAPALVDGAVTQQTRTQTLRIGATTGIGSLERYGMIEGRPVVVQLPVPVLQAFFRHVREIVDPTGCGSQPGDVKKIRIRTGDVEFDLRRELDRWVMVGVGPAGTDTQVPAPRVEELLAQLTTLRATSVELADVYPRELEAAVVTLYGFAARPIDTVRILYNPESQQYAFENGDNVIRIFEQDLQLRLTPEDYGIDALAP
jgi:hypothetical protein